MPPMIIKDAIRYENNPTACKDFYNKFIQPTMEAITAARWPNGKLKRKMNPIDNYNHLVSVRNKKVAQGIPLHK